MATQRLKVAHLLAASPSPVASQLQMASYASTFASAQAVASCGLRTQPEWHPEAVVNLRLLGKGVGWALGIEGVTALSLYAVWFLWHLRL
ncbi:MAG: hypothetical protein WCF30_20090 [Terracidiphilus sp.]